MIHKAFLETALQTGVSIALLIGLVLLIRPLFAKYLGAKATYMLWLLPFLRLFLPPIKWEGEASDITTFPLFPVQYFAGLGESMPVRASVEASAPLTSSFKGLVIDNLSALIITIWLSVALLWIVKIIFSHRSSVQALRLNSDPVSESLENQILTAQQIVGIKRAPEVRKANFKAGPLVTCPWSPLLILPEGFETKYTDISRRAALAHELAHIKRHDLWAVFIGAVFRALNWPNPLVHVAFHYFRIDLEAACDEYVIHTVKDKSLQPHDYAKALLGPDFLPSNTL